MKRHRRDNVSWKMKPFSTAKAVTITALLCLIALAFVHREVKIDEAAKRIREQEAKIAKTQVELAEAKIALKKLSSFPRIAGLAKKINLKPLTSKANVTNIELADLPPEFFRELEPLKIDSGVNDGNEKK